MVPSRRWKSPGSLCVAMSARYPRVRSRDLREGSMAEVYLLFVFEHLAGLVLFAISHGASAFMAFRLRSGPDVPTAQAILKMGQLSITPMYIGLLLLIIGGLGAAASGALFGRPWVIASIVVFIAVLLVMWIVSSPYYMRLRKSLEERAADGAATVTWDDLKGQLDSRRPEILLSVGTIGLLMLVWLMVIKPSGYGARFIAVSGALIDVDLTPDGRLGRLRDGGRLGLRKLWSLAPIACCFAGSECVGGADRVRGADLGRLHDRRPRHRWRSLAQHA